MAKITIISQEEAAEIKREARKRDYFRDALENGWRRKVHRPKGRKLKEKAARKELKERDW